MPSRNARSRLAGIGVALLATGCLTMAGPVTAAQASPGDCVGGANGFIDIPDNQGGTTVRTLRIGPSSVLGNFTVTLRYATIGGWQRGFARLEAGGSSPDFWMETTTNGGGSWLTCGPFNRWPSLPSTATMTTPAKITQSSSLVQFRACAGVGTEWGPWSQCTDPW